METNYTTNTNTGKKPDVSLGKVVSAIRLFILFYKLFRRPLKKRFLRVYKNEKYGKNV
jgi:hypothetical protein